MGGVGGGGWFKASLSLVLLLRGNRHHTIYSQSIYCSVLISELSSCNKPHLAHKPKIKIFVLKNMASLSIESKCG